MSGGVRRTGREARKKLDASNSPKPEILVRRAQQLSNAGVPTPIGRHDQALNELVFPWIDGITGEAYLRREIESAAAEGPEGLSPAVWGRLIDPLVRLHGSDPSGLDLRPLDPWRKIHPRIEAVGARSGRAAVFFRRVEASCLLCARALAAATRDGASRPTVVHGDFHARQLLMGDDPQMPWLLDLEDLALGAGESDLGNFVAHLVTSPRICGALSEHRFSAVLPRVQQSYQRLGGRAPEQRLLLAHGAIALLRRALKGWERNADPATTDSILAMACAVARDSEAIQ
jgi:aminoglycoside phosphotransferase (APT) family kinase protein